MEDSKKKRKRKRRAKSGTCINVVSTCVATAAAAAQLSHVCTHMDGHGARRQNYASFVLCVIIHHLHHHHLTGWLAESR